MHSIFFEQIIVGTPRLKLHFLNHKDIFQTDSLLSFLPLQIFDLIESLPILFNFSYTSSFALLLKLLPQPLDWLFPLGPPFLVLLPLVPFALAHIGVRIGRDFGNKPILGVVSFRFCTCPCLFMQRVWSEWMGFLKFWGWRMTPWYTLQRTWVWCLCFQMNIRILSWILWVLFVYLSFYSLYFCYFIWNTIFLIKTNFFNHILIPIKVWLFLTFCFSIWSWVYNFFPIRSLISRWRLFWHPFIIQIPICIFWTHALCFVIKYFSKFLTIINFFIKIITFVRNTQILIVWTFNRYIFGVLSHKIINI